MLWNSKEKADLRATSKAMKSEMDRLLLKLFGYGNTNCMNISRNDHSGNAILSDHETKIHSLTEENERLEKKFDKKISGLVSLVKELNDEIESKIVKKKVVKKKISKKKTVSKKRK